MRYDPKMEEYEFFDRLKKPDESDESYAERMKAKEDNKLVNIIKRLTGEQS